MHRVLFLWLNLCVCPQVSVMVVASGLSVLAAIIISSYSCLTLTYGQEDKEVFHHHNSPEVVTSTHTITVLISDSFLDKVSCSK